MMQLCQTKLLSNPSLSKWLQAHVDFLWADLVNYFRSLASLDSFSTLHSGLHHFHKLPTAIFWQFIGIIYNFLSGSNHIIFLSGSNQNLCRWPSFRSMTDWVSDQFRSMINVNGQVSDQWQINDQWEGSEKILPLSCNFQLLSDV